MQYTVRRLLGIMTILCIFLGLFHRVFDGVLSGTYFNVYQFMVPLRAVSWFVLNTPYPVYQDDPVPLVDFISFMSGVVFATLVCCAILGFFGYTSYQILKWSKMPEPPADPLKHERKRKY